MTITTSGKGKAANKAQPAPPAMPVGAKNMIDTIAVTTEPLETTIDKTDAQCFTPSEKMARTPPQQTTNPGAPPGAPSRPTRGSPMTVDFCETDDWNLEGREAPEGHEADDCGKAGEPPESIKPTKPGDVVSMLHAIRDKLTGMSMSRQNNTMKAEIINTLDEVINTMAATETCKSTTRSTEPIPLEAERISNIERDIKEIKAAIQCVAMAKPKTWAQVAAASQASTARNDKTQALEHGKAERLEKQRKERAKTELTLSTRNASSDMKKQLANLEERDLIQTLQDAAGLEIRGVRKMANDVLKIRCSTERDAETLRNMDWKSALDGATVIKPMYGIVVHGVPKYNVDFEKDKQEELKTQIEDSNCRRINVEKVMPLRRRARNPNATTQSIVILTESPEEADEGISNGINIEHRHYAAERHTPQCQIKQCFNCQGYGHKADICTKKVRCGKCGQNHETKRCVSEELQCTHCKGSHAAWHYECPARKHESERLEALRTELSPYFTS